MTEESLEPREAGWYPDPFERLPRRWWNGTEWTGYAADSTVRWDDVPGDEEPQPTGPRGIGVGVVAYVMGVTLAAAIAIALNAADEPGGEAVLLVASQFGLWLPLLGACVLVSRRRGTGSLAEDYGWRIRPIDVGLGFAGAFVARVVSGLSVAPIPIPTRDIEAPERDLFERVTTGPWDWVAIVFIVVIGAPLIEELFFRGLLQSRLVEIAGTAGGIVITSVLFGAAHLIAWEGTLTLIYGVAITGAGVVLGLMRHITGRLGPPIMAHFFFNGQAVLLSALLA